VSFSAPVRFALEAAVLVAVALALVAGDLELLPFVLVMGAAWVLVATAERMLAGPQAALPRARRRSAEDTSHGLPVRRARDLQPRPEAAPQPAREAAPAEREPEAEPEVEVEVEPEREPGPHRPLEAVPGPEPEPEPETVPVKDEVEAVVELPQSAHRRPDGWNLWDLEQRAHARAGEDLLRDEEWNALLVSLRDFAQPDGTLPGEFDELVEESFVELISRRA
jgi:hypothetical protein